MPGARVPRAPRAVCSEKPATVMGGGMPSARVSTGTQSGMLGAECSEKLRETGRGSGGTLGDTDHI